ncbi:hypothetical protein GI482_00410 [Bacillus sp. N3536]|nr:hypothetical protein GI482_00410 [Bacillus sp. N3536]
MFEKIWTNLHLISLCNLILLIIPNAIMNNSDTLEVEQLVYDILLVSIGIISTWLLFRYKDIFSS